MPIEPSGEPNRGMSRRDFLRLSGLAAAGVVTTAIAAASAPLAMTNRDIGRPLEQGLGQKEEYLPFDQFIGYLNGYLNTTTESGRVDLSFQEISGITKNLRYHGLQFFGRSKEEAAVYAKDFQYLSKKGMGTVCPAHAAACVAARISDNPLELPKLVTHHIEPLKEGGKYPMTKRELIEWWNKISHETAHASSDIEELPCEDLYVSPTRVISREGPKIGFMIDEKLRIPGLDYLTRQVAKVGTGTLAFSIPEEFFAELGLRFFMWDLKDKGLNLDLLDIFDTNGYDLFVQQIRSILYGYQAALVDKTSLEKKDHLNKVALPVFGRYGFTPRELIDMHKKRRVSDFYTRLGTTVAGIDKLDPKQLFQMGAIGLGHLTRNSVRDYYSYVEKMRAATNNNSLQAAIDQEEYLLCTQT